MPRGSRSTFNAFPKNLLPGYPAMTKTISLLTCLTAVLATLSAQADDCCQHCGCQAPCQKVCRVVCEVQKVPVIYYTCECEDFCVPGPSHICGKECQTDCCGHTCRRIVWAPGCGKPHTRKKPVKHQVMVEKCVYKYVVEYLCPQCCPSGEQMAPLPEAPAEAPAL
jgi:hypothetical protein